MKKVIYVLLIHAKINHTSYENLIFEFWSVQVCIIFISEETLNIEVLKKS